MIIVRLFCFILGIWALGHGLGCSGRDNAGDNFENSPHKLADAPETRLMRDLRTADKSQINSILKHALRDHDDLTKTDRQGKTTLHYLLSSPKPIDESSLEDFIKKSAPVINMEDKQGRRPLNVLMANTNLKWNFNLLQLLLTNGMKLDLHVNDQDTLIHTLIEECAFDADNDIKIAVLIVNSYPQALKVKNKNGQTPIDILASLPAKRRSLIEGLAKLTDTESAKAFAHLKSAEASVGKQSSLVEYEAKGNNKADWVFDKILSEANYQSILKFNDLSYAVVRPDSPTADKYKRELESDLGSLGWSTPEVFNGRTGLNNMNPDKTGVVSYNKSQNCILVTFHGSYKGSLFTGAGDWGANMDYNVVSGNSAEAQGLELPEYVQVHRGFAQNLRSAKKELFEKLDRALAEFKGKNPWIIVTGHSKGGAMATLIAPIIKLHLKTMHLEQVRVGAIVFSSPRVFHGDKSKTWVQEIIGKSNILRVSVPQDLITQMPPENLGYSYRNVGMSILDNGDKVDNRIRSINKKVPRALFEPVEYAGRLHYGIPGNTGLRFDSRLVMPHRELKEGLLEGLKSN